MTYVLRGMRSVMAHVSSAATVSISGVSVAIDDLIHLCTSWCVSAGLDARSTLALYEKNLCYKMGRKLQWEVPPICGRQTSNTKVILKYLKTNKRGLRTICRTFMSH